MTTPRLTISQRAFWNLKRAAADHLELCFMNKELILIPNQTQETLVVEKYLDTLEVIMLDFERQCIRYPVNRCQEIILFHIIRDADRNLKDGYGEEQEEYCDDDEREYTVLPKSKRDNMFVTDMDDIFFEEDHDFLYMKHIKSHYWFHSFGRGRADEDSYIIFEVEGVPSKYLPTLYDSEDGEFFQQQPYTPLTHDTTIPWLGWGWPETNNFFVDFREGKRVPIRIRSPECVQIEMSDSSDDDDDTCTDNRTFDVSTQTKIITSHVKYSPEEYETILEKPIFSSIANIEGFIYNGPCIYVLECKDGFYYVGFTRNLSNRMINHTTKHGQGSSVWVRLHPVVRILEICEAQQGHGICHDTHTENRKTLDYMLKYGKDKVRGGKWTKEEVGSIYVRDFQYFNIPLPPRFDHSNLNTVVF